MLKYSFQPSIAAAAFCITMCFLDTCKLGDLTVDNGRIEFPVKNQVVLEDRVMIGAQISISCDKDFIVSQPSSIICTQYGNWTAEFPYCYKGNVREIWINSDVPKLY